MDKRDNRQPGPARGVLRSAAAPPPTHHARITPAADLAWTIEHYWSVRWDLRGSAPQQAQTLPHPSVHWVFDDGQAEVAGVSTRRFSRELSGAGRVFGVKFRPGGFRPWLGRPVRTLSDRRLALAQVIDPSLAAALLEDVHAAAGDDAAMVAAIEPLLRAAAPAVDPQSQAMGDLVLGIIGDRELTRVEQLVDRHGIGLRTLQRLFGSYIGVSPKWVINRYRLHEALECVHAGTVPDWAALALQLGYCDQAHFIRDFRTLVGMTPLAYARQAGC